MGILAVLVSLFFVASAWFVVGVSAAQPSSSSGNLSAQAKGATPFSFGTTTMGMQAHPFPRTDGSSFSPASNGAGISLPTNDASAPLFTNPGVQISTGVPSGQYNGGPNGITSYGLEDNAASVAGDPSGNLAAVFASGTSTTAAWGIWYEYSLTAGASWAGLAEIESPGSGLALAEPSVTIYQSGGVDYVCVVYLSISTGASNPQGNYFQTCNEGSNPGSLGAWSAPLGNTGNGDGMTAATISGPTATFDESGNLVVAYVGESGGTYYWAWDIYSDVGTYSAHYTYTTATLGYYVFDWTVGLACTTSGCSTAIWGVDTALYFVEVMLTSTNDYASIGDSVLVDVYCDDYCGYVGYPGVEDNGPGSVAGSGSNWAAALWYYDGANYWILYCYSTNLWSSTSDCSTATSPAGGVVADSAYPQDFPVVTIVGSAPFMSWETGSATVVVDESTSMGGAWIGETTVSSGGYWPILSASPSSPWEVNLAYLTTATKGQFFYTDYIEPWVSSFNPSPAAVDVNQAVTFSPTYTGGTGVYSAYSWSASSTNFGCGVATGSTYGCTPTSNAGSPFTVTVTVTDSWGFTGTVTSPGYTVYADPTVAAPTANISAVDVGQSVTFTSAVPGGGLAPYGYSWTTLPTGCVNSNAATDPCVPTTAGTYSVVDTVTDANSYSAASPALSFTVDGPLSGKLAAAPLVIDLSQSFNLTVTTTGGAAPYSLSYSNLPRGCNSANANPLVCTPTASGLFSTIAATVKDGNSAVATTSPASVTVNPKLALGGFNATPSTVTTNSPTSLNVSVSGGTTPYTYSYSALPTGCVSSNVSVLKCVPTVAGNYTISVTVKDAVGMSATATTHLTVAKPIPPLKIVTFVAVPSSIVQGASTNFTVTISGGVSPYIYSYTGLPKGCSSANLSTLLCTPQANGTFSVGVKVTDARATIATSSTNLTISPLIVSSPKITSFTAVPDTIDFGQMTNFSVVVSGGAAPYTYAYSSLPTGCKSVDSGAFPCTPSVTGTFTPAVLVTDNNGKTARANTTLVVKPTTTGSGPTISSIIAIPNPLNVGQTTEISVTATGGTPPYTLAFSKLPPGCSSSNSNPLACTPTSQGNYSIGVTVTDKNGLSSNASYLLTVNPVGTIYPLTVTLSSNLSKVTDGELFTLSALVSGGKSPFNYYWSLNGTNLTSAPDSPTWTLSIAHPGNYTYAVLVVDSQHTSVESGTVVVEAHALSHVSVVTNTVSSPFPWWIVLVLLAAVTIVLLLVVERRRRASNRLLEEGAYAPYGAAAGASVAGGTWEPTPEPAMAGSAEEAAIGGEFGPPPEEIPAASTDLGASQAGEVQPQGVMEQTPPPTTTLTQCPQCNGPLDYDMTCPACGVNWVPEQQSQPEQGTPGPMEGAAAGEPSGQYPEAGPSAYGDSGPSQAWEAPPPEGQMEGTAPPAQCPQCGNPLDPDMNCQTCQINWAPDQPARPEQGQKAGSAQAEEAPTIEAPSVGICPNCNGQVGPDLVCRNCGMGWVPDKAIPPSKSRAPQVEIKTLPPLSMESEEARAGIAPEATSSAPEAGRTEEVPQTAQDAAPESPHDVPEVSEIEKELEDARARAPPPAKGTAKTEQKPAAKKGPAINKCMICGSDLDGDYCHICDMHWEG
jgi:hypothetical protein